jgi:multicomponent Na+:H+ antiporter subunit F
MIAPGGGLLGWAVDLAFVLLLVGMAGCLYRLRLGPSLPDRVVALDLITIMTVAMVALYTIAAEEAAFLDVAIALALVAFLATVAFARYAERRAAERPDDHREE